MTRQADVAKSMNNVAGGNAAEKTSAMRTYDQTEVQARMAKLRDEVAQKNAAEKARAEELAAVVVDASDITLVAASLNLSEDEARHRLQVRKGDVVAVLREGVGLSKK